MVAAADDGCDPCLQDRGDLLRDILVGSFEAVWNDGHITHVCNL